METNCSASAHNDTDSVAWKAVWSEGCACHSAEADLYIYLADEEDEHA